MAPDLHQQLLSIAVVKLVHSVGFKTAEASTIQKLSELFEKFLLHIATSINFSSLYDQENLTINDGFYAIKSLGVDRENIFKLTDMMQLSRISKCSDNYNAYVSSGTSGPGAKTFNKLQKSQKKFPIKFPERGILVSDMRKATDKTQTNRFTGIYSNSELTNEQLMQPNKTATAPLAQPGPPGPPLFSTSTPPSNHYHSIWLSQSYYYKSLHGEILNALPIKLMQLYPKDHLSKLDDPVNCKDKYDPQIYDDCFDEWDQSTVKLLKERKIIDRKKRGLDVGSYSSSSFSSSSSSSPEDSATDPNSSTEVNDDLSLNLNKSKIGPKFILCKRNLLKSGPRSSHSVTSLENSRSASNTSLNLNQTHRGRHTSAPTIASSTAPADVIANEPIQLNRPLLYSASRSSSIDYSFYTSAHTAAGKSKSCQNFNESINIKKQQTEHLKLPKSKSSSLAVSKSKKRKRRAMMSQLRSLSLEESGSESDSDFEIEFGLNSGKRLGMTRSQSMKRIKREEDLEAAHHCTPEPRLVKKEMKTPNIPKNITYETRRVKKAKYKSKSKARGYVPGSGNKSGHPTSNCSSTSPFEDSFIIESVEVTCASSSRNPSPLEWNFLHRVKHEMLKNEYDYDIQKMDGKDKICPKQELFSSPKRIQQTTSIQKNKSLEEDSLEIIEILADQMNDRKVELVKKSFPRSQSYPLRRHSERIETMRIEISSDTPEKVTDVDRAAVKIEKDFVDDKIDNFKNYHDKENHDPNPKILSKTLKIEKVRSKIKSERDSLPEHLAYLTPPVSRKSDRISRRFLKNRKKCRFCAFEGLTREICCAHERDRHGIKHV